jgi:glycogen phosphorylase/synthase
MNSENLILPDYLFEVSWEVCNKVGGIHTVIATKSLNLSKELKDRHILIGPDVWMDTERNPEFIEDNILFRTWRVSAAGEGLRIRVGRWNVAGNPVAILVDFSQFISKKDEILTDFWKKFQLDSLSGQWDYIESALFGYASGKVIESFIKFNLLPHHKVVAQFHEWMTGAGLLYLKGTKLPVASVFTTHATVVGRCLACNNIQLYNGMDLFNADAKAKEFNVLAKHSLEKCAAHNADVFTTVSEITAKECNRFLDRKVDFITPNGFENTFTPQEKDFNDYEEAGRKKLIEIASLATGETFDNPLLIGIGGRYEYKNKGIDIFIDSLDKLNRSEYDGRKVLAFIMIPAGNNGPNRELLSKINNPASTYTTSLTHYLQDIDSDQILCRLKSLGLDKNLSTKIKVIYVPTYLNGSDGVFNMTYYNLLAGMDLSIFPSYYEPWGYTPLESLAFKVPTVTTSLAGFGMWVETHYKKPNKAAGVIFRDDSNYDKVVNEVFLKILEISTLSLEERKEYKDNAKDISEIALWKNNIKYYKEAYSSAISKVVQERGAFPEYSEEQPGSFKKIEVSKPSWSRVMVTRHIPERLKYLDIISKNLWWCWNQEAMDLFRSIDNDLWKFVEKNPIALLDLLSLKRYKELEKDDDFLEKLDNVTAIFNEYMKEKESRKGPSIAYFCMEYGLDTSLKIYSGGLGILAGDYLKESSDMKVKMTGVGLLYRYGYFTQKLTAQGDQVADYEPQDFMKIPAIPVRDKDDKWVTVSVAFPGRNIYARLWRVDVGRTELYLMDTDFEDNLPEDRQVTYHLYGGDWENRLKQELLLGIGGIRALRALGIEADIYHCNEGHAAFTGLERLRELTLDENLSFGEALEVVRASSLFTTHTPVPAGHDAFSEDLLRSYMSHYPARLKIDWTAMMALGKINPEDKNEKFSMSNLASNLSQDVNGVSWLHGKVSQDILSGLWPGYLPEELHVGYVTNGVHYSTWTAPQWKEIHKKVFGPKFQTHHYDKECFQGIYDVQDEEIWKVRGELRARLIEVVNKRLSDPVNSSHYSPQNIVEIKNTLRDDILTIGFARRFATYKRAHLLFRDLDRLDSIINNPDTPVQFLFAGKAHPADKAGQDLIKKIIEISKMPQFIGKIVFIPNYDINLAKFMVQGVDVWMNTPTRPLEASGTSGEKAVMNGVMHFSVLDGWWVEGYKNGAGWALPMERTYDDQNFQDELDAATIYDIIENDIAPTFYEVDKKSLIPQGWIQIIKKNVAQVACNFTTNRMLNDYLDKYYKPLYKRSHFLNENDYSVAREIALWKKKIRRGWEHIEVVEFNRPTDNSEMLLLGKESHSWIKLFVGDINPEDIGVELVYSQQNAKGRYVKKGSCTYEFKEINEGVATYSVNILPTSTGVYQVAARIFAKNSLLPHRQDFELVKWL